MNDSKMKVVSIIGKVCSFLGFTIAIFFGLPLVTGAYGTDAAETAMAIFLIAIGVGLIIIGIKTKRRTNRYKTYVDLITDDNITSIKIIASNTSQSVDFVRNELQTMIDKKFLLDAHIDSKTDKIIRVVPSHNEKLF